MGAATKLAFAVFLISCCSGGCGGGSYCQLFKHFSAKVAVTPVLFPHYQQGACARSGAAVAPEGPCGDQTNTDWHLQPNFIHV